MTAISKASVWKDIPGFPNYQASDEGHIRNKKTGHIKKPVASGRGGHLMVYAGGGRRANKEYVHRLVALAFHGFPEHRRIACHIDGNPKNNSPQNVYWGTYSDNTKDSIKHGTFVALRGSSNGMAKLSLMQAQSILSEYDGKRGSQSRLARKYGVCVSTVHMIVHRQTWPELTGVSP